MTKVNATLPPLYGKTSAGKLQIWYVHTKEDAIHVHHGLVDGKKQEKVTRAQAKNIGKSNETTPAEQAVLEAQSKWQYQKDRGYFETKEEALDFVEFSPMKAQGYVEQGHKLEYPTYVQPKLDGMRLMLEKNIKPISKSGLDVTLPAHWVNPLRMLEAYGLLSEGLDGEVYAGLESEGGLSLQAIISAFRKPNENTHKLEYHVYDIPGAGTFEERAVKLAALYERLVKLEAEGVVLPIKVVWVGRVADALEADEVYNHLVQRGYEGMMYRNAKGLYEHGKRSYDLLKRKRRQTTEAKVLATRVDKNEDGVLTCELETGVQFECLMRKDAHSSVNYRKHQNSVALIGKFIEVEFESYSLDMVPLKPVGRGIREVEPTTWEPKY